MADNLALSLCRFNPFAGGTADFVVNTVVTGFALPSDVGAIDGKVYRYWATNGTQTESGSGAYNATTHTVARNADGGAAKTSFTTVPVVDLIGPWVNALTAEFANLPQSTLNKMSPIPSGTSMLFQQPSVPIGWTRVTGYGDRTIRVSDGTVSYGGVNSFSSTFSYRTDDATYLSISQIPFHTDTYADSKFDSGIGGNGIAGGATYFGSDINRTTFGTGGGSYHQHTYDMRVTYVDVLIASKN